MDNIFELLEQDDPGDAVEGFEVDTNSIREESLRLYNNLKKLRIKQLQYELKKRGMSLKGKEYLLKTRLKKALERELDIIPVKNLDENIDVKPGWNIPTRYIACIDFEATCDSAIRFDLYEHEIIEFPAVIIDTTDNKIVDVFHSYVKPKVNQELTKFCMDLTGIKQETIDSSLSFPEVLNNFFEFIKKYELPNPIDVEESEVSYDLSLAAHGVCDIERFFKLSCKMNEIPIPPLFKKDYLDMQKHSYYIFRNFKKFQPANDKWSITTSKNPSLLSIISGFNLTFEGNNHSGIDDATNVAKVLLYWAKNDIPIVLNKRIKV